MPIFLLQYELSDAVTTKACVADRWQAHRRFPPPACCFACTCQACQWSSSVLGCGLEPHIICFCCLATHGSHRSASYTLCFTVHATYARSEGDPYTLLCKCTFFSFNGFHSAKTSTTSAPHSPAGRVKVQSTACTGQQHRDFRFSAACKQPASYAAVVNRPPADVSSSLTAEAGMSLCKLLPAVAGWREPSCHNPERA